MEYHLLILNDSNESLVCKNLLKVWGSTAPVVVLFGSKNSEDLSDLELESHDFENFKDSTVDSNKYKYSLLYHELNKFNNLSQQEFETLHNNLSKYLKTTLFRPLLLLFKKNNNFKPSILFNLKSILLYYYPLYSLNKPDKIHQEDKDLLYWYIEFDFNYNFVGTNNRLIQLLDELENRLNNYNPENLFLKSLLSTLNMYLDGLLFRKIPLNKYINLLKYTKLRYSTSTLCLHNINNDIYLNHNIRNDHCTQTHSSDPEITLCTLDSSTTRVTHSNASSTSNTVTNETVGNTNDTLNESTLDIDKEYDDGNRLSLSQYRSIFLDNKKPYHIASAIAYTNGFPHVGHAYEAVVCDVISRYYKMFGRRVIFSTGTDEHGIKVMTTAKQQNKTPIEICNFYSEEFKKLYKRLLVEYDRFIRTTSKEHILAAKSIWKRVYNKGDIYLGVYNGYYSVREERFIPNTEAKLTDYKDPVSGKPYDLMSESSYFFKMNNYKELLIKHIKNNLDFIKPLKCRNEILARLKEPLEDLSVSRTTFDWGIQIPELPEPSIVINNNNTNNNNNKTLYPGNYYDVKVDEGEWCNGDMNVGYNEENKLFNETKFYNLTHREQVNKRVDVKDNNDNNMTTTNNNNMDGSNTTNKDNNNNTEKLGTNSNNNNNTNKDNKEKQLETKVEKEKHVMYVWFDALSFYMTASGLGESFSEMTNWPTDLQVIGKDISWFQSVILATMCFSMELPLTKKILAHGFIQGPDGRKMSKSLGNVLNLDELLKEVGPESFRYYLLKSTVLGQDVNFDIIQLKEIYNSDLADNVGNLIHRLTSLVNKYNQGILPKYKIKVNYPFDLVELLKETSNMLIKLDLYNLLFLVSQKFKELNNYLTTASPWNEKDENKRNSVLRVMLESVYFLGHLLYPVLPDTTEQLFNKLGTKRKNNMWELSLNLDNLQEESKVLIGDILFPKFTNNTTNNNQ